MRGTSPSLRRPPPSRKYWELQRTAVPCVAGVREGRPMPVFFFDLHLGPRQLLDDEGTEFPSALAARAEALATVRDLVKPSQSAVPARWLGWSLRVRDELGTLLLRLPIGPSSTGSEPDTVPPMLVSARPALQDLPLSCVDEGAPKPSTGDPGAGRTGACRRARPVRPADRTLPQVIEGSVAGSDRRQAGNRPFATHPDAGPGRLDVMRGHGLIPTGPAHRDPPLLLLAPISQEL